MADLPEEFAWRSECNSLKGVAQYQNTPQVCARLISAKLATLKELQTDYSLEDAYRLDEIATVDAYHSWLATRKATNG